MSSSLACKCSLRQIASNDVCSCEAGHGTVSYTKQKVPCLLCRLRRGLSSDDRPSKVDLKKAVCLLVIIEFCGQPRTGDPAGSQFV